MLDFLLDESASFSKALGERLKDRVFGEVFPYFAEGFIKHGPVRPSTTSLRDSAQGAHNEWTDDDLIVAFQATLTFLYRLLFVLYAEARDLLPVRETRGYWEVSLQRIKEEIAAKAGTLEDEVNDRLEKAYSASETTLYDRLLKLFRGVARGTFVTLGAGEIFYHLTYIDDLVEGFRLCGEIPAASGRTYILAGGEVTRLNELVARIAAAAGVRPPRLRFPVWPVWTAGALCEAVCVPLGIEPPLYRRRVDFFTKSRAFNIARARRELGFSPRVGLDEGIRRTLDWYRAQGWI